MLKPLGYEKQNGFLNHSFIHNLRQKKNINKALKLRFLGIIKGNLILFFCQIKMPRKK